MRLCMCACMSACVRVCVRARARLYVRVNVACAYVHAYVHWCMRMRVRARMCAEEGGGRCWLTMPKCHHRGKQRSLDPAGADRRHGGDASCALHAHPLQGIPLFVHEPNAQAGSASAALSLLAQRTLLAHEAARQGIHRKDRQGMAQRLRGPGARVA